jgi:hypothetical protein
MKPQKNKKYVICFINPVWDDLHFKGVATHNGEIDEEEGWFGFNVENEKQTVWFAEEDIICESVD